MMKLNFKLKKIRIEQRKTYRELSLLSDVSTNTIQKIEKNIMQKIPLITLLKLAEALEVEVTELYEIEEEN